MKKQLLTIAAFCSSLALAHAQAPAGIFEITSYEISTEWDELTGKEDTTDVKETYTKYRSSDTAIFELKFKSYKYFKGGYFDMESYALLKSEKGIKSLYGNIPQTDSTISHVAVSNGSINWKTSSYSAATFENDKVKENTMYIDFSDYGLPGFIPYTKESYGYPSANVVTKASYATFPTQEPRDSSVFYMGGNGFIKEDTLLIGYEYNDETMTMELSEKTTRKFDNNGNEVEKIDYNYVNGSFEYSSKTEYTYVSESLEIEKRYNWYNSAWKLSSLDSSYHDSQGQRTLRKSYVVGSTGQLKYSGKSFRVNSLTFTPSSPVPSAASELTVTLQNLRTEGLSATASYLLTWKDNSYNEDKFEIYRKEIMSTEPTKIGEVAANTTSYVDATADDSKTYQYYVVAVNGNYKSAFSNLAAPTSVVSLSDMASKYNLYPNPSQTTWTLGNGMAAAHLQVMSLTGQVLSESRNSGSIDASELESGTYIVKIELQDGTTKSIKAVRQ
jgi:hypothetical protein